MKRAPKELMDAAFAAARLIARISKLKELPPDRYADCVRMYCDLVGALHDCRPDNEPEFRSTCPGAYERQGTGQVD